MARHINEILQEGITFRVDTKIKKRNPGFLGLFQKKKTVLEKQEFTIKEPTLQILDLIAKEAIALEALAFDSDDEKENQVQRDAKTFHMAKIVSLAVSQSEDDANQLINFFTENLKPSELKEITNVVDLVSNTPDFLAAIGIAINGSRI